MFVLPWCFLFYNFLFFFFQDTDRSNTLLLGRLVRCGGAGVGRASLCGGCLGLRATACWFKIMSQCGRSRKARAHRRAHRRGAVARQGRRHAGIGAPDGRRAHKRGARHGACLDGLGGWLRRQPVWVKKMMRKKEAQGRNKVGTGAGTRAARALAEVPAWRPVVLGAGTATCHAATASRSSASRKTAPAPSSAPGPGGENEEGCET